MAKCFLAYSHNYRHIMEAVRGLLKALDFESVDVVDGPDDQRPPIALVEERITAADCVVVLYGPVAQPETTQCNSAPAKWPAEEAVFALGQRKPMTLLLHLGTDLPELLKTHQSPARFDFWNPKSFQENAHHVVKHLLDFKRRVDLPPGNQPYRYRKVENRMRVDRSGARIYHDFYHEVVVAKTRSSFHHALGVGDQQELDAVLACFKNKEYEIEAGAGGEWHRVWVEPGAYDRKAFQYLVKVEPSLEPGEVFGYRRSFDLPNRFPMTAADTQTVLKRRPGNPDFPPYVFEGRFFGEAFEVVYDADVLVYAYHFPKKVVINNYRVTVVEYLDRLVENKAEGARCKELLKLHKSSGSHEQVLELIVPRPLFNHAYYLLYEPGA